MKPVLAYTSDRKDGPADVVVVDESATTHGTTIVTRRYLVHEATVLASRVLYNENRDVQGMRR